MRDLKLILLLLLSCPSVWAAAPTRDNTYVNGTVIEAADVTANEDNIFEYLQAGVDTYFTGSVNETALGANSVNTAELVNGSVNSAKVLDDSLITDDIQDNTLTTTDFSATLNFSDGDSVNLSSINMSSSSEGLVLGQAASCSSATAEGQVCWDSDDNLLYIGTSSAAQVVGNPGTPALTFTTSNAAGSASTLIRTDASIAIFDTTAPADLGSSAATGSAAFAARRDHVHANPGPWVFVETLAPSGVASVTSSTLNTSYNIYKVVFEDLTSTGGGIYLQFNGSTSDIYDVTTVDNDVAGVVTFVFDDSDPGGASYNGMPLDGPTDPGNFLEGDIIFHRVVNGSSNIVVLCNVMSADIARQVCTFGDANTGANATSVTIASGTGNITGSIHLFGLTR